MRGWWDRTWPSLVALIGTIAVVAALLFLFGRQGDSAETTSGAATGATTAPGVREDTAVPQTGTPEDVRAPVLVLNASQVKGLAARTEDALVTAGWPVSGTENWSGDVARTTLFYPEQLQPAAETLARAFPELATLAPAQDGMRTDQLTLVLTGDVDLSEH
jgi:LytR cell envelope-related transcriptional attenuator